MTVIYNTNFTHNPNSYLTISVTRAAREVFGAENCVVADNRSLAEIAAKGEHEVLLCLDGQRLDAALLRRVRPAFKAVVFWLFEDPFMLDYNIGHASLATHIFTNDPSCVAAYLSKGHYLPLAGSRSLDRRNVVSDESLEYDVFFAGTMWPNRVFMLRRLMEAFPSKSFKLICPTNDYLPPLPADIAGKAIKWPINHESFIDFANASRVTLTMFRNYASHGTVSQATSPGPRMFELALAGTAQVVELDGKLDPAAFRTLEGVAICQTIEDVLQETALLLDNPISRQQRAETALRSGLAHNTYEDRLRTMAGIVDANWRRQPAATAPVIAARRRKIRVLMCTHSTIHQEVWGGVEVYQQILSHALSQDVEVFFWLRRGGSCRLQDNNGVTLEEYSAPEIGWLDALSDAPEEVAFSNVIGTFAIDVVHFQHLGHHAASLPIIAKATGIGVIFSAHDFFLVCSRYNLLNYEQTFCDIGNKDVTACDNCLKIAEGIQPGAQQTRRAFMSEVIRSLDVMLFGTDYSRWLTQRVYPAVSACRLEVTGIPSPGETRTAPLSRTRRSHDDKLKVAVIGNFIRSKGADMTQNVIAAVNPNLFEFHIVGQAEAQYEEVLRRWPANNVVYHGRYGAGILPELKGCDVALHLSIWPETYCISLSEAWQHGLVPIVCDIGAFADRVIDGVNGFKIAVGDLSAIVSRLEALRSDGSLLERLRAAINSDCWVDNAAYAQRMLDIYRSVTPSTALSATAMPMDLGHLHLLPHRSWKEPAPPRHIFDPSRRPSFDIELPERIASWDNIQGSHRHIDDVCGSSVAHKTGETFTDGRPFTITGWTFVPSAGVAGQLLVGLVSRRDGSVIYGRAGREARDDITKAFPGAPSHSGFRCEIAPRGKWSDGTYDVVLVNVIAGRAAFTLTDVGIAMRDGLVLRYEIAERHTAAVMNAYAKVSIPAANPTPRSGITLKRRVKRWRMSDELRYTLDNLAGFSVEFTELDLDHSSTLWVRGWACIPGCVDDNSSLYLGLLPSGDESPVFVEALQELRLDVAATLPGAPERCGFNVILEAKPQLENGTCRLVIVLVANEEATVEITDVSVQLSAGCFVRLFKDSEEDLGPRRKSGAAMIQRLQLQSREPDGNDKRIKTSLSTKDLPKAASPGGTRPRVARGQVVRTTMAE